MGRHLAARRRRAPLAAALLLVHTACYSYVPLQPPSEGASATASGTAVGPAAQLGLEGIEQGVRLRVHLSEPGSYPLAALTPNNVTVIDGDLVVWDDSVLTVSAYWMKTAGVQEFKGSGETVAIPIDKIDRVDQKKVSAGKTAGVAAAIVGVVVLLGVTFGGGSGEGGDNGPGGPPD
jgi:hypothetical protein